MKLAIGDEVTFRTTGYEVADIRNPNPPKTATGFVNAPIPTGAEYIPVWCEREGREPTTIMVSIHNIVQ